jgi:hypothetical protein
MSFLDDLENSLKSLENSEEGRANRESEHRRRESQRAAAQAAAPFAEQLKHGPFTAALLRDAARVGHSLRTKIQIAWLGSTLRLEARDKRLELRPTAEGIVAARMENGHDVAVEPLDLTSEPEQLLRAWLEGGASANPALPSES